MSDKIQNRFGITLSLHFICHMPKNTCLYAVYMFLFPLLSFFWSFSSLRHQPFSLNLLLVTFHIKTPYCLLHTESRRSGFLRFHRETGPEEEADAAAAFLSFRRSCTFNWPDWRVKTVDSTVTMAITEWDGRQSDLTAAAATSAAAKTLWEAGIFLSFAMFFPVATGCTAD